MVISLSAKQHDLTVGLPELFPPYCTIQSMTAGRVLFMQNDPSTVLWPATFISFSVHKIIICLVLFCLTTQAQLALIMFTGARYAGGLSTKLLLLYPIKVC